MACGWAASMGTSILVLVQSRAPRKETPLPALHLMQPACPGADPSLLNTGLDAPSHALLANHHEMRLPLRSAHCLPSSPSDRGKVWAAGQGGFAAGPPSRAHVVSMDTIMDPQFLSVILWPTLCLHLVPIAAEGALSLKSLTRSQ